MASNELTAVKEMGDFINQKNDLFRGTVLKRLSELILKEIMKVSEESELKLGNGFSLANYLEAHEKNIISYALSLADNNQIVAARLLGVKHTTLNWKIKRYQLHKTIKNELSPADSKGEAYK